MRFWISFIPDDSRPVKWPMDKRIIGAWCSGYTGNDEPTEVALVQAETAQEAEEVLFEHWPEIRDREWRFWQEVEDDYLPGDRFPIDPERLAAVSE